jgi:hypothetical protein
MRRRRMQPRRYAVELPGPVGVGCYSGRDWHGLRGRILGVMTTRSGAQRSHLASSPFKPKTEPVIERFELHDRVSHQSYGLGRVVGEESAAVTVDFGNCTLRIVSPFHKLERL